MSLWGWLWRLLVLMLPCVGVIMVVIWAFVGGNSTTKNFFRALIVITLIGVAISVGIMLAGLWPEVEKAVRERVNQALR